MEALLIVPCKADCPLQSKGLPTPCSGREQLIAQLLSSRKISTHTSCVARDFSGSHLGRPGWSSGSGEEAACRRKCFRKLKIFLRTMKRLSENFLIFVPTWKILHPGFLLFSAWWNMFIDCCLSRILPKIQQIFSKIRKIFPPQSRTFCRI